MTAPLNAADTPVRKSIKVRANLERAFEISRAPRHRRRRDARGRRGA